MTKKHADKNLSLCGRIKTHPAKKRLVTLLRYIIPVALKAVLTQTEYCRWLRKKSLTLLVRDRKLKRPCALNMTISSYERAIHRAACANALTDPFTGETLRWDLVGQYDPKQAKKEWGYFKRFYLLPSVDHVDPDSDILEFEICAWLVNLCKGDRTPAGFVALCNKIVAYRRNKTLRPGKAQDAPASYFLPPFLEGILPLDEYRKWLESKAHHLFVKDQKGNRPCVSGHTCAEYRMAIHAAVLANGPLDPYTGEAMDWKSIGATGNEKGRQGPLAPSVDHTDPDATDLEFEICSLTINECKNNLDADEFVGLCRTVVAFWGVASL